MNETVGMCMTLAILSAQRAVLPPSTFDLVPSAVAILECPVSQNEFMVLVIAEEDPDMAKQPKNAIAQLAQKTIRSGIKR